MTNFYCAATLGSALVMANWDPSLAETMPPQSLHPLYPYVFHGGDCRELRWTNVPSWPFSISSEPSFVVIDGTATIPARMNRATVILNGWRLTYLDGDHHLRFLHASIENISLNGASLTWRARGSIADVSGIRGFRFCYNYTVLAWWSGSFDFAMQEVFVGGPFIDIPVPKTDGVMRAETDVARTPPSERFAAIPQGFSLNFSNRSDFEWLPVPHVGFNDPKDHHVRQLALASQVSWWSAQSNQARVIGQGIIKDNKQRDTGFSVRVALLSSKRPALLTFRQNAFALSATDGGTPLLGGCLKRKAAVVTEEVEVRNLAFGFAIPVLTGWDLRYDCDDEQVKDVGVWIDSFEYTPGNPPNSGVLRYRISSILKDKNDYPGHSLRHNVDIIGIKR